MANESIGRGFDIRRGVLSVQECELIIDSLANVKPSKGRAGIRHLMGNPAVKSIANDERLLAIACDFVGSTATPYKATLFRKTGNANWLVTWHQDTALPLVSSFESSIWGPWSNKEGITYAHAPASALSRIVALRINLDDSTDMNGPLRVIPGTHSLGVLLDDEVFRLARDQKEVACLAPRGSVIAMRPLLIHSSSKLRADLPRRVLHIEYTDSLDLGEKVRIAIA